MNKDLILSGENTGMEIGSEVATISKAINSPLVNNSSDADIRNTLLVCISESYTDLKQPVPSLKDLEYTADKVLFNLRKHKKNIRIKEIQIAFANGILEQYGKFYGLSVATFTMFISEYCKDQNRLTALFQLNTATTEKEKPSFNDMFTFAKQNALNGFISFCSEKDFSTISTAVYDFLMYSRFFRVTKEEITDLMGKAAKEYEMKLRAERERQSDNIKRKDYTKKISELFSSAVEASENPGVLATAKKMYLNKLFAEMKFSSITETEFSEELERLKANYFKYLEWLDMEREKKLTENKK